MSMVHYDDKMAERSRRPMLLGEIILQGVREGKLLRSITKDVNDYGTSKQ